MKMRHIKTMTSTATYRSGTVDTSTSTERVEVLGMDSTGREWDAETEMYSYRLRTYAPDMGRFISEDPLRFGAGDVNFYRYVGNNPISFIDPLGLTTWPTNNCTVTRGFTKKITFTGRPHTAADIDSPEGFSNYATDSGVVIEVDSDDLSGNYIKIRLPNGDEISYSHTSTDLKKGECVEEGQAIGVSDKSGTDKAHLHFVYRSCTNGKCDRTDPLTYLSGAVMVGTKAVCNP